MKYNKSNDKKIRLLVLETNTHIMLYNYQSLLLEFVSSGKSQDTVIIIAPKILGYGFGYYDDIDTILRYDRIKKDGIDVMRRVDGGGCIFHDYTMGAYYVFGIRSKIFDASIDKMIDVTLNINEDALIRLGVKQSELSRVHGDIRWRDKKIGSMSLVVDKAKEGKDVFSSINIPVFNRSLPDMLLNEKYAIVSKEKMKDKAMVDQKKYFAALDEVIGRKITLKENVKVMRQSLIKIMADNDIKVSEAKNFTLEEQDYLNSAIVDRGNEGFICRVSSRKFYEKVTSKGWRYGYAQIKYAKLIKCFIALSENDSIMKDVCVSGDIHISPNTVMDCISESLVNVDSNDSQVIKSQIENEMSKPNVKMAQVHYISPEEICEVVKAAVQDAVLHYRPLNEVSDMKLEYLRRMAKFIV